VRRISDLSAEIEDKEKSLAPRLQEDKYFGMVLVTPVGADFSHSKSGFTAAEYGQKFNENRSNYRFKFYPVKVWECIGLTRENSKPMHIDKV